jgi:hypothetical protein
MASVTSATPCADPRFYRSCCCSQSTRRQRAIKFSVSGVCTSSFSARSYGCEMVPHITLNLKTTPRVRFLSGTHYEKSCRGIITRRLIRSPWPLTSMSYSLTRRCVHTPASHVIQRYRTVVGQDVTGPRHRRTSSVATRIDLRRRSV